MSSEMRIDIPIVVSTLAPPGNKPKMRERQKKESAKAYAYWLAAVNDTRPFYMILVDRDGNRVEYWRGWVGINWATQIAEAFPGKCAGCVGEIENGKVNPDGTHDMRFGASRPEFYEFHGEPCAGCRQRRKEKTIEQIISMAANAGIPLEELIDLLRKTTTFLRASALLGLE